MNVRFGMNRKIALAVTALTALTVSTLSTASPAAAGGGQTTGDHWGVIARNTIGSPVAALRNGPFVPAGGNRQASRPPYGQGSLGIEVADHSTSLTPPSEKVDFGNEVDFAGDPVQGLKHVGFHVFQTGENIGYGGGGATGAKNMPNIRFEIDPNLTAAPTNHFSTLNWLPDASPVPDGWSPYLDATTTGSWWLTGAAGTTTGCNQATPCSFQQVKTKLNDGGPAATILTAAVGKGRDYMWIGAVDGLRINQNIYDFEADGVHRLRVR
ncbi:hypothetical protein [Streptomyces sp. DW26H14]|uniref:hypothetical protein n=1 Tax=Streptomyces sp. DW26H14 TaxID=3435395 RepID=UPI00403E0E30